MTPLTTPPNDSGEDINIESILGDGKLPDEPIPVKMIGSKLLVFNNIYGSLLYGFNRYFGTPVGIKKPKNHIFDTPLELTVFEGFYLLKKKIIRIYSPNGESLSEEDFISKISKSFPNFNHKYLIYEDLREKKYIPRPGQKFGADFIVYEKGPGLSHSSFCILVQNGFAAKITSLNVVTAGRLATSVKKNFILANPLTKKYYKFKWIKP